MFDVAKVQQFFLTAKHFKNFLEKSWLAILTDYQPRNKNLKPYI